MEKTYREQLDKDFAEALAKLHKVNAEYNKEAEKAMPIIKRLSHVLSNLLWASENDPHNTIKGTWGTKVHASAVRNIIYGGRNYGND